MENIEYDVVIVGSGIAGAITAKILTDAGKKVLVLDAGLESGMALEGDKAYQTQLGYLQRFYNAIEKTPNSPFPNVPNAPSSDVREAKSLVKFKGEPDTDGYFVQHGPMAFGSDNWVGAGGTTQHWTGTTLRMLPNDFEEKSKYGRAVDWPFGYRDLVRFYEMAEFEIGVAGNVDEQDLPNIGENYFSPGYVFPMKKIPQTYLDQQMLRKTDGLEVEMGGKAYKIRCCSTPQGRNSVPNPQYSFREIKYDPTQRLLKLVTSEEPGYQSVGALWDQYTGQRCEGNSSCAPICPVQAKYNALKTFQKAKRRNKELLEIRSQCVAYSLLIAPKNSANSDATCEIEGVRYKRYENAGDVTFTTHLARGKIYVLAASAIENAKILLASNAANSSDQVGRNLMDHLCLLTWGLFPEKVYPFRGPGSTTNISNFRDGDFRKDHAAWICPFENWGWSWPLSSPRTDVENEVLGLGKFGKELRHDLNNHLTRQILLDFECEQEPDPNNRVTIDPKYKDILDNYRPVIHYDFSDYMKKAFEAAKHVSDQIFQANGIEDKTKYGEEEPAYVTYEGNGYTVRGAGHIAGTHRMGKNREDSVVNADMRTWDHPNLFLMGNGNMPTMGTSNPTLTLAALTYKAAEAILNQLEGLK